MNFLLLVIYFVVLLAILAATDAFDEDDFSCDKYSSVRFGFNDCLLTRNISDIEDMLQRAANDGILTGNEILTKLTETCSNLAITEGITFCIERLSTECPVLQHTLHDAVQDKLSFFCENYRPSSTIRNVLENGLKFNDGCSREDGVREVFRGCAQEAFSEIEGINIRCSTVSEALSLYEQLFRTWFQCCVEETRDEILTELSCGSTWKDILIYFWLSISGHGYLRSTVPSSVVDMLKVVDEVQKKFLVDITLNGDIRNNCLHVYKNVFLGVKMYDT